LTWNEEDNDECHSLKDTATYMVNTLRRNMLPKTS